MTRPNTSWSGHRTAFPKAVRSRILKRDPVCVICGSAVATIADHEPNYTTLIRAGVENPHEEKYGQGVCVPCHDQKTLREAAAGRARLKPKRTPRRHPSDPGGQPRSALPAITFDIGPGGLYGFRTFGIGWV